MSKTLDMIFKTDQDKRKTISIADPRKDITRAEVSAVMSDIIARKAFLVAGGALTAIADIKVRTVEPLA